MFNFKFRVGKSYVPIVVSAIALILGTYEISNLATLGTISIYIPLYWLSIAVVTLAIFLQYLVQNRLETQVDEQKVVQNRLETQVDEQDEMIYELQLQFRIMELENQIRSVEETLKLQNKKSRKNTKKK